MLNVQCYFLNQCDSSININISNQRQAFHYGSYSLNALSMYGKENSNKKKERASKRYA